MLFILFLLTSTYALKTPILSIPIQTCQPATLSQTQERCTYNYNIINNYTYICATKLFIPNGCGNDKYVIFNLYNGNSLIDTYRKSYKEFRYINILSDIKLNVEPTLSFKIVNNITISREVIGGRIVFLVVDFYIDTDGTTSPTSEPTTSPTSEPTPSPTSPTSSPTSEPTYPTSEPTYPTPNPTPEPTLDPTSFSLNIWQANDQFQEGNTDIYINGGYSSAITMSNITLPTGSGNITFTLSDFLSPYEKLNGQWDIGIGSNTECVSNNINSISKADIDAVITDSYYAYCGTFSYSEINIRSVTILPETSSPTSEPTSPTSSPTSSPTTSEPSTNTPTTSEPTPEPTYPTPSPTPEPTSPTI